MFTGREEAVLAGKDEKFFMMKNHLNSALVSFRELCTLQLWANFIQMFLMTIDFYLAGLPNSLGKVCASVFRCVRHKLEPQVVDKWVCAHDKA